MNLAERYDGMCYFDDKHGLSALEYELLRLKQRSAPEDKTATIDSEAFECALYGAEQMPAYFGDWTPPLHTPRGPRCRYQQVDRGVYFVDSAGTWFLAVVHPIADAFCKEALVLCAPPQDAYYVFWLLDVCAPALYELIWNEGCERARAFLVSMKALREHLYYVHVDYTRYNNELIDKIIQKFKPDDEHIQILKARYIPAAEYVKRPFIKPLPTYSSSKDEQNAPYRSK